MNALGPDPLSNKFYIVEASANLLFKISSKNYPYKFLYSRYLAIYI